MTRAAGIFTALRDVFRNANLRRVESAWGGAITAEWIHFVALGVFAYDVGGPLAVGVVGLVRMLPAGVIAPFAAFLGDRFRRERFLAALALIGATAIGGSAVAFFAGENEVVIFGLAAVAGVVFTLVRPAHQALLPSLAVTPEELIASNGATSTIEGLGTLVGPLVAGLLVSTADVGVAFAVAAAALVGSAALLLRTRVEGRIHATAASALSRPGEVLRGLVVIAREPNPRLIVALMVAQTFVRGCLNVLIVVIAFRLLDAGEGTVGYMTAALGVGGLVGSFGALTLAGRRLAVPFGLSLVFWGIPIALIAAWPRTATALLMLAVVGAANAVEDVAGFTLVQRLVRDEVLARVLGALWGLAMGGVAVGSIAASALVEGVGPRAALVVVGAILPLLIGATWMRLRAIDRTAAAPAAELSLLDSVPMLAPLSVAAKEHLAARVIPLSIPAGETVIRQGESGDRFYIVGAGELEVIKNGRRVIARGPGDYFGEIALLRGVPRTATVTALTDSEVLALEREDFVAAVTEHSAGRAAGEAVVASRLAPS